MHINFKKQFSQLLSITWQNKNQNVGDELPMCPMTSLLFQNYPQDPMCTVHWIDSCTTHWDAQQCAWYQDFPFSGSDDKVVEKTLEFCKCLHTWQPGTNKQMKKECIM